ncbi:MAG: bifunctional phosphoribosyl-AMP cyclohydrolase/phosphoribosyl-ATP diphosphatase HisIE [Oscillospiraceae bacterium]|nr:bifunctional phosphoribosyl-AMP cyclohydrolase/phosphoribosyl-ATP diphosphatase HisIE [Oscillospiraceae bacterium]
MNLKFTPDGLVPVITREYNTGAVLMQAYMNADALAATVDSGYAVYYSRSRQELWRKGESSGHVQQVVRILTDCDRDCLLLDVVQTGVACHTGSYSCFEEVIHTSDSVKPQFTAKTLHEMIIDRKNNPSDGSYTAKLFEKGIDTILKKIGEETAEVIIAAKGAERENAVYELADLYYHVGVMMAHMGIAPEEVEAELARRHSNPKVE